MNASKKSLIRFMTVVLVSAFFVFISLRGWAEEHSSTAHTEGQPHSEPVHATNGHDSHTEGHTKHLENLWSWNYGEGKLYSNPPFLFAVANFLLLVILLVKFVRKPLGKYLVDRHDKIERDLKEAATLREKAKQRLADIEQKLNKLNQEIADIKASVAQDAEQEKMRLIAAAKKETERIIASADRTIQQEIIRIRRKLEIEAVNAAMAAAEKLLVQRVTESDHKRIHEEYLDNMNAPEGKN